jgi:hypothetical protein
MEPGAISMSRFLVFYYAPSAVMEQMQRMTPELGADMIRQWFEWKDRCGDAVVEIGGPLMNGQKVTNKGNQPSRSELGSYSVLQAESMEDALVLLEGHPHLSYAEGCTIEIFEAMPSPQN